MTDIDLNFIARQVERVLTEQASQRDDMRVLTAMVLRVDNTMARDRSLSEQILEELRAMHAQITRMNDRIRKLEDAAP